MRPRHPEHLKAFAYVGFYRYFLTFCTDQRRRLFVRPEPVDLATSQFLRAAFDERFSIIAYCFMPDHVHLLVTGEAETSDCKRFIVRAKQFSGYAHAHRFKQRLWQRYGYERVLRNQEDTREIVRYILENPMRAGLVARIDAYPFIGSSLYGRSELVEYVVSGSG
ncbi:MAG: transposase [Acidobacteria bacterium]|nr:transposase [Acidobacteriota bacterium]